MTKGEIDTIQKLLQGTKEEKIPWKFNNSNAVSWIRLVGGIQYTTLIQAGVQNYIGKAEQYNLTIQNATEGVLMQVVCTSVQGRTEFGLLDSIFELAKEQSINNTIKKIDKLFDGL